MSIDNSHEPNENDWTTLKQSLRTINEKAVGIIATDTEPTESTVPPGRVVLYDNGSGTKRLYFRTGKDNIGYVNLT